MTRIITLSLLAVLLIVLLALSPILPAAADGEPTQTYTPIPTRTPAVATQAVIVVHLNEDTPLLINRSVSYGDVYVVVAIAAVFCLIGLIWAYSWVRSHFQTQERQG